MACAPRGKAPPGPYIAFAEEVGADSCNVELLRHLCPGCAAAVREARPGALEDLDALAALHADETKRTDGVTPRVFAALWGDWMKERGFPTNPSAAALNEEF